MKPMTFFRAHVHFGILLAFSAVVQAAPQDRAIAKLFAQHDAQGTIVISSLRSGQVFIHNERRANSRFTAASTFKILNTLIALDEDAVSATGDAFKWNGSVYSIATWNQDQTLESAFRASCVWCFREVARKVGAEKYRKYLRESAYGKLHEPFVDTAFWLDGSLEISAVEQVEFIKKVCRRALPFSDSSYETLRHIMLVEQTPSFTMRAKTGLAGSSSPQVGWYVGYIETATEVWVFATNLDIHSEAELPLRQKLTREALSAKGVLD